MEESEVRRYEQRGTRDDPGPISAVRLYIERLMAGMTTSGRKPIAGLMNHSG